MKKIIVIIFLFIAAIVSAQNIPAEDTTAKPAITAIGKPDGEKAEMKIGKDGGSFTSSDGKIKLIIPEGAISKKTTFSIQPMTNTMPNGNGKAYQLEPSGIQFQKPIQLLFHYDPEESEDSTELLMGIAMQDDKGQWYGLKEFTLDTVAKTISGNINHFSTWVSFDWLRIEAPKRLKVSKSALLEIVGVDMSQKDESIFNEIDKDNTPLQIWKPPRTAIWRVNGIIKGNAEFGTLARGKIDEDMAKNNFYTAPANVPDWNPVIISVELVGASLNRGKGKTIKNPRLKTKILIYDNAYEVTMISSIVDDAGSEGIVTYKDTGSFVISLNGKKSKIIEKLNKNTIPEMSFKGGRCTMGIEKPGYGNIHIAGASSIIVIPATVTFPATVAIKFVPIPSELPILHFTCTSPSGEYSGNTAKGIPIARMIPAFPIEIRFDAREGEQVLYEMNMGGIFFKATVKQLKED